MEASVKGSKKRRSAEEASAQPSGEDVQDIPPYADAEGGNGPAGGGSEPPQIPGTKVRTWLLVSCLMWALSLCCAMSLLLPSNVALTFPRSHHVYEAEHESFPSGRPS